MPGIEIKQEWQNLARATDPDIPGNEDRAWAMTHMGPTNDAAKVNIRTTTGTDGKGKPLSPADVVQVVSIPTTEVPVKDQGPPGWD